MSCLISDYQIGFHLDTDRFLKRMHMDGAGEADRNARACIPGLLELAKKVTRVRAVCLTGQGDFAVDVRPVDCCLEQKICLCFLGPEILDKAQLLMEEGEYLEGYLLSEMANDILFHASSQMDRLVEQDCQYRKLYLTRKYYPGDPDVPVEALDQYLKLIKKNMEPDTLDIRVSAGGMLIPEKAMLYLFGADPDNEGISQVHDCKKCLKKDCAFRI